MFKHKLDLTSFVLEMTPRCNHDCKFCYNVWKCRNLEYPKGQELSTEQIRKVISKLKNETKIKYLALSGGEPLLREDTPDIINFCFYNFIQANLLTNGSLLTEENCRKCHDAHTSIFEVPFLSTDEATHYKLTGQNNLKDIIQGIKNLKKRKTTLIVVFVATRLNIDKIKETLELAIALGTDGIMFNRFNPGGRGLEHIAELMPSLSQIKEALAIVNDLAGYYGVAATASVPIPKCLVNPKDFKHMNFGYCPSGNHKSYFTIDAYGNVRICNHNPEILGNILKQDFKDIYRHSLVTEFQEACPEACKDCKEAKACWGGCKAAAQLCCGGLSDLDPFLKDNLPAHA